MKYNYFIPLLFTLVILSGIILWFTNIRYQTEFDWDQEYSAAYPAEDIIKNHHFPLIGAKTSVGNLYIAPLYSYIAALGYAVFGADPIFTVYVSLSLGIITLIVGVFLMARLYGKSVALLFALYWSASPFILQFARIPWNVNLLLLSSICFYAGLLYLYRKTYGWGWLLVAIGLFIGINSHFSVMIFMAIAFVFMLLRRDSVRKEVVYPIASVLLAILPLVIFNARHDFVLSKNALSFATHTDVGSAAILPHLFIIIRSIVATVGKVFFIGVPDWIPVAAGVIVLSVIIIHRKIISNIFFLLALSLFMYLLAMLFYSGPSPDYYYAGFVPLVFIALATITDAILKRYNQVIIFLLIFVAIQLYQSFLYVRQNHPLSLGYKLDVVQTIKTSAKTANIGLIKDMDTGRGFGYDYILHYYGLTPIPSDKASEIYWISFPVSRFPGKPDYTFGDIALGSPTTVASIYRTKDVELYNNVVHIRVPVSWSILSCPYNEEDMYLLTPNIHASCGSLNDEKQGMDVRLLIDCKTISTLTDYSPQERRHLVSFDNGRCILFRDRETIYTPYSQSREIMDTILGSIRY